MADTSDSDFYGRDIMLGPDGDLVVSATGDISVLDGPTSVVQGVRLRLLTRPGEVPLQPTFGSQFADLVGTKGPDATLVRATLMSELQRAAEDVRILGFTDIDVQQIGDAAVGIALAVTLVRGEQVEVANLDALAITSIDTSTAEVAAIGDGLLLDDDDDDDSFVYDSDDDEPLYDDDEDEL